MKNMRRFKNMLCAVCAAVLLGLPCLAGCEAPVGDNVAMALVRYSESRQYIRLYKFLSAGSQEKITLEEFAARYDSIYQTIGLTALACINMESVPLTAETGELRYQVVMQTDKLGEITLNMAAPVVLEDRAWKIVWSPQLILPGMGWEDSARLYPISGKRGEIFDKNGNLLACNDVAQTVYIQTGDVTDFEAVVRLLAPLLGEAEVTIRKKLSGYVEGYEWTADEQDEPPPQPEPTPTAQPTFWQRIFGAGSAEPAATQAPQEEPLKNRTIAIKAYPKGGEPDAATARLIEDIPGVYIDNTGLTPIRFYPYGRVFAHGLGYCSTLSAEDLQSGNYNGYPQDALVGRAGLEAAYESVLRATAGYELVIVDKDGLQQQTLAYKPAVDGCDLRLSIDIDMQMQVELELLDVLTEDMAGAVVVMNPMTGYIEAMASYPSYDPNVFSIGATQAFMDEMNDPASRQPLYNRATLGGYPPGSTFKPFTALVGLDTGAITPGFVFTEPIVSNVWTPSDSRWSGAQGIKRVSATPGSLNLYNAMTYSDNIYFAYTAMKVGEENFMRFCSALGFGEDMPFDLPLLKSQIANNPTMGSLRLLADSGYGQGELSISPVQMAALFSSLRSNGDIMVPRMVEQICKTDGPHYQTVQAYTPEIWKEGALSAASLSVIQPMLRNVVAQGTGKQVDVAGLDICGKTGTAEIGNDKEREIAWFIGYTTKKYERLVCVTLEVPASEIQARYTIAKHLLSYEPNTNAQGE